MQRSLVPKPVVFTVVASTTSAVVLSADVAAVTVDVSTVVVVSTVAVAAYIHTKLINHSVRHRA